jgi:hypothetical protein
MQMNPVSFESAKVSISSEAPTLSSKQKEPEKKRKNFKITDPAPKPQFSSVTEMQAENRT